jgi:hypothetical protein
MYVCMYVCRVEDFARSSEKENVKKRVLKKSSLEQLTNSQTN